MITVAFIYLSRLANKDLAPCTFSSVASLLPCPPLVIAVVSHCVGLETGEQSPLKEVKRNDSHGHQIVDEVWMLMNCMNLIDGGRSRARNKDVDSQVICSMGFRLR